MKLLPHLYQVACPQLSHGYDASAYLLDTGEGPVLVDCGTPQGFAAICANIKSLGFRVEDIRAIFGTHGHYDHVGAAALFREQAPGCRLYLHERDARQVEEGDAIRTTAGLLYGSQFPKARVDSGLEDGVVYMYPSLSLTVLHTPGHTPGGVCFRLETDGMAVLIAGDTLWGGYSEAIGSDQEAWRESLERLCSLPFDSLTFGHTGPSLYGDANARLREARAQFAVYYNPWFKPMAEAFRY